MSDRQHALYVVDLFIAIDKIYRYTNRFDNAQELLYSELEWDGAIRELEIIGEATNYLLKANQIIHGYFGIDENIVFDVIRHKLPQYYDDLLKLSKNKTNDILEAIHHSHNENNGNQNVLNFLNQLSESVQQ